MKSARSTPRSFRWRTLQPRGDARRRVSAIGAGEQRREVAAIADLLAGSPWHDGERTLGQAHRRRQSQFRRGGMNSTYSLPTANFGT